MKLDDAQKKKVQQWIEEGLKLSEIQAKLGSELGLSLTYMEMRFLMADLGLQPKDKVEPPPPAPPAAATPPKAAAPGAPVVPAAPDDLGDLPAPSNVSVTVDALTKPGAMVSGKVTFSDGKSADWYLDQMGRLGLAAKEAGYRPPTEDIETFQEELQRQLAKLGF